jgi:hypothetical protein
LIIEVLQYGNGIATIIPITDLGCHLQTNIVGDDQLSECFGCRTHYIGKVRKEQAMNKCIKCGAKMDDASIYCKACSNAVKADSGREQKKERVMGRERTWIKPTAIAAAIVFVAVSGWFLKDVAAAKHAGMTQSFAPQREQAARHINAMVVNDEGGVVRIPLASVEGSSAHFFTLASGGKKITFFAMRAPDGRIRTAFDACLSCNHAKLGYRQEGDLVVCNNCGMGFKSTDIGRETGGCNPIPVNTSLDGKMLVLKTKDLEAGAQYF